MAVTDCGMEVEVAAKTGVLLCSIESSDFITTFVWNARGNTLSVWMNGKSIVEKIQVLAGVWRGKLTFGRLDGRDFVMLDDSYTLPIKMPGKASSPMPRTWLHIGVLGGEPAVISHLRVFRDVFSYRQPELSVGDATWPRRIEAGHWFLLGDNAFDSRDSRHTGSVAARKFLGVPTYVIGPMSRARKLVP